MSVNSNNEPKKKFKLSDPWLFGIVFFSVILMWSVGWWSIDHFIHPSGNIVTDYSARGQFGDKFGAINALFAGFAFAGIILTIFLQSREIKQSKRMLEEQLKDSNKQRFDSTFFQLVSLHNEITKNLYDVNSGGRESFNTFNTKIIYCDNDFIAYEALNKLDSEEIRILKSTKKISSEIERKLEIRDKSNLEKALEDGIVFCENYLDPNEAEQERKIKTAYTKAEEEHVDKYSNYFRNLYHTLLFIDKSDLISDLEKIKYSKIIRSQLSEPELVGLFYNSLTKITLPGRDNMELGHPKMGRLLCKYDILQNISPRSIIHPVHIRIFNKNNNVKEC